MNTHILKTDPVPFSLLVSGTKNYELRPNDRDFKVNDLLQLRETRHSYENMINGAPLEYTGRFLTKRINHVLEHYGLLNCWVILSISDI